MKDSHLLPRDCAHLATDCARGIHFCRLAAKSHSPPPWHRSGARERSNFARGTPLRCVGARSPAGHNRSNYTDADDIALAFPAHTAGIRAHRRSRDVHPLPRRIQRRRARTNTQHGPSPTPAAACASSRAGRRCVASRRRGRVGAMLQCKKLAQVSLGQKSRSSPPAAESECACAALYYGARRTRRGGLPDGRDGVKPILRKRQDLGKQTYDVLLHLY